MDRRSSAWSTVMSGYQNLSIVSQYTRFSFRIKKSTVKEKDKSKASKN